MGGTSCNSTPNSTSDKSLTIRAVRAPRWNGGTSNDKNYFSCKFKIEVQFSGRGKDKI